MTSQSCPKCKIGRLRWARSYSSGDPDHSGFQAVVIYECSRRSCGYTEEKDVS
jgi:hypothetical protein